MSHKRAIFGSCERRLLGLSWVPFRRISGVPLLCSWHPVKRASQNIGPAGLTESLFVFWPRFWLKLLRFQSGTANACASPNRISRQRLYNECVRSCRTAPQSD